jgi:hypothetical protein
MNSLPERQALRKEVQDKFVGAVNSKLPEGTSIQIGKWRDLSGGGKLLSVGIKHDKDQSSSAWSVLHLDQSGNLSLQQHDISLSEKMRGSGTGGKMIEALVAGYRAMGAGKNDIPIHVNTNPSFWKHMNQKHGGIFSDD